MSQAATIAPAEVRNAAPMSVMDAIRGRRSVRAFQKKRVERATIRTLLEAAVLAPTAMHAEPWAFVVIQHPGILARLAKRAQASLVEEIGRLPPEHRRGLETFESEEFDALYGAGTLVVICARGEGSFADADCWLAAENLMLAAHAMGLGTCVIGCSVAALNAPEWKDELGLPADVIAVAPVIVGFPEGETPATSRKAPEILAWR